METRTDSHGRADGFSKRSVSACLRRVCATEDGQKADIVRVAADKDSALVADTAVQQRKGRDALER